MRTRQLCHCTLTLNLCATRWERLHQRLPHGTVSTWCKAVWNRRGHKRNSPAYHRTQFQRHVQIRLRNCDRLNEWMNEHSYSHPGPYTDWVVAAVRMLWVFRISVTWYFNSYAIHMESQSGQWRFELHDSRLNKLNDELVCEVALMSFTFSILG